MTHEDPAPARTATLAELIAAFAAPLLELDAKAAADPEVLPQLMLLVDMCWNLPLLETNDPVAYRRLKQGFDAIVNEVPAPVAEQLAALLADRKSRFGELRFLVHTRVDTDAAGKARIVPEARRVG